MLPSPAPAPDGQDALLSQRELQRATVGVLLFAVLFPVAHELVGHHGQRVAGWLHRRRHGTRSHP